MKINRLFTTSSKSRDEGTEFEKRTSRITNPDGSPLREAASTLGGKKWRGHIIKTERAAMTKLGQEIAEVGYGYAIDHALCVRILEALAHKHGTTVADEIVEANKRAEKKCKRDGCEFTPFAL